MIFWFALVLQSGGYRKIHILMSEKKKNPHFYGENIVFNLHHVKVMMETLAVTLL